MNLADLLSHDKLIIKKDTKRRINNYFKKLSMVREIYFFFFHLNKYSTNNINSRTIRQVSNQGTIHRLAAF